MKPEIIILPATAAELSVIQQLAQELDLDIQELAWQQFVVAKRKDKIVGFGRLREYPECVEIATVGVVKTEQKNGIGSLIVSELIRIGPGELFVTCVIPDFFGKFGFQKVKQYPSVLQKKVDFCKLYDFSDEQIFVMKITK